MMWPFNRKKGQEVPQVLNPDGMKLCIQCKHYSLGLGGLHRCWRKSDPVIGGPGKFADIEREYNNPGNCGSDGKYWEAK